jgi:hypothetical protein
MAPTPVLPSARWSSMPPVRCQSVANRGAEGSSRCTREIAYLLVRAEAEGFEPPDTQSASPVFKTGAFNRTRPHLQERRV